jgi:hypothetical protein
LKSSPVEPLIGLAELSVTIEKPLPIFWFWLTIGWEKVIPPLLSGGFIEYKSVISVLLLKVRTIGLNHPT